MNAAAPPSIESAGRWPRRQEWARLALGSIMIGLVYVMYHQLGTAEKVFGTERSALNWMVFRWKTGRITYGSVYYFMGWMTPLISLGLVWLLRERIRRTPRALYWPGLVVVIGSLVAHYIGVKTQQERLSLISLIGLLWGVPLFFWGRQIARQLFFPAAFLIFCVPLNFLDAPMFRTRIVVARFTAGLLNGLGIECTARAASIESTTQGGFVLQLPPADTGLGAFLIFMAGMALAAYFARLSLPKKGLLFLSAWPCYMAGMSLALVVMGVVAQSVGAGWTPPRAAVLATGIVVLAALFAAGTYRLLAYPWRQGAKRWLRQMRAHRGA